MDSRVIVALATIVLPAVLVGLTIWRFASNPLSILGLLTIMMVGCVYLLSYTESF
jgi:hypothetical protein